MKAHPWLALLLIMASVGLLGCDMLPGEPPLQRRPPPTPDVLATQAAVIVAARGTSTPRATSPRLPMSPPSPRWRRRAG